MKRICYLLNVILLTTFLTGIVLAQAAPSYESEISNWHKNRLKNLQADNGWLNLVGLFWLEDGQNSFGSGPQNKLVFPAGTIPEQAGCLLKEGNTVKLVTLNNTAIQVNGKSISEAIVYHKDSMHNPIMSYGNLRFNIIVRDGKPGVRLRNLKSPAVANFKGIDRFPVDPSWKVEGTLEKSNDPGGISITNVLGQTSSQNSPGKLVFTLQGKRFSLDVLEEGDKLFLIFGDSTSGLSTYPSGRYLYADKPNSQGKTIIDFNKAYNPPCAFTPYATCPLPPKQNILSINITAGEKNFDSGH